MKIIEKRTRVRNYEKLCELLEVESKTNAEARKKQLDELRQFYIIVKDKKGNGYSVQSRKEPKPDKPVDKTRNGKYSRLMNGLVMNYLMNGYTPKSYSLIASDLFKDLKFMSYTKDKNKKVIVEKYGEDIYKRAYDAINEKIFELLSNSFKSLLNNENVFYIKHHVLIGEPEFAGSATSLKNLESDIIIEEMTNKMLEEKGIKKVHFLNIQGEKVREKFYKERNERLNEENGFEVKEKLTYIDIINVGSYKKYNPVKYKMTCEELFEQIRNDLISKLDISDNKDIQDLYSVIGDGSPELMASIKTNSDNKLLKELYEEYIVYAVQ